MYLDFNLLANSGGYVVFNIISVTDFTRGAFAKKICNVQVVSIMEPSVKITPDAPDDLILQIWGHDTKADLKPIVVTEAVWEELLPVFKEFRKPKIQLRLSATVDGYLIVQDISPRLEQRDTALGLTLPVQRYKTAGGLRIMHCEHPGYDHNGEILYLRGTKHQFDELPVAVPSKWFDDLQEFFVNTPRS